MQITDRAPIFIGLSLAVVAVVAGVVVRRPRAPAPVPTRQRAPAPVPTRQDRCTALFDAAKQEATRTYAIRFERAVPTGDLPDEMTLSGKGAEVEVSVEPDRRQLGSDLVIDVGDDLPGWRYDLYSESGLTLGTYEAAANGVFVRFRIDTRWNRDDGREDVRPQLVHLFTQAGDRCLGR